MNAAKFVGAKKFENLASGDDDFLGFTVIGAGEVAVDCTDNAGGSLQSEIVEIHGYDKAMHRRV